MILCLQAEIVTIGYLSYLALYYCYMRVIFVPQKTHEEFSALDFPQPCVGVSNKGNLRVQTLSDLSYDYIYIYLKPDKAVIYLEKWVVRRILTRFL